MKKSVLFFLASMATSIASAQSGVGIGTDNPQGVLHIDGAKDNASTGTPTPAQLANDVIIGSNGKIGVGQLPEAGDSAPLQVNGPITIKANAAEDPQPGVTYVLASTNGTQQAKWLQNVALSPTVIGNLGTSPNGYSGTVFGWSDVAVGYYTGASITLPEGSWIIQSSILLTTNTSLPNNSSIWSRMLWGDTPNIGTWSTDIITGRYVSGIIPANQQFGLAVGTTLITNKSGANKTYYLNIAWSSFANITGITWNKIGSADWSENSIVAFPVISL